MPIAPTFAALKHQFSAFKPLRFTAGDVCVFDPEFVHGYYEEKLRAELALIFSEDNICNEQEKADQLRAFLAAHHKIIPYTALPDDSYRHFLCDIAEYVGDQLDQFALNILIPTLESITPSIEPDTPCFKLDFQSGMVELDTTVTSVEAFSERLNTMEKNGVEVSRYRSILNNVTKPLVSLVKNSVEVLRHVAEYTGVNSLWQKWFAPFSVAQREESKENIHTVDSVLVLQQEYVFPDIYKMPLSHVLNTHILDENQTQLVPIALVFAKSESQLVNPYWDSGNPDTYDSQGIVSSDTLASMQKHSKDIRDFIAAKENNEMAKQELNCLYDRLLRFCHELNARSAHNGGSGTQSDAAYDTYMVIIDFFENYYALFDKDQKALIPKEVRIELDLLYALATDPERNHNATIIMDTCIGTRSEHLLKAVYSHQAALAVIMPVHKTGVQNALAEQAAQRFQVNQQLLVRRITQGVGGTDQPLTITPQLLNSLKLTVQIRNWRGVNAFLANNSAEMMRVFFADFPELINQISACIEQNAELLFFLLDQPIEKLEVLFSLKVFLDHIKQKKLFDVGDLSSLLDYSSVNREKIQFFLKKMIVSHEMLESGLDVLEDPRQKSTLLEMLSPKLSTMLPDNVDEWTFLRRLNEKQCKIVILACVDKRPEVVKTNQGLNQVLRYLDAGDKKKLFAGLRSDVESIMKIYHALYRATSKWFKPAPIKIDTSLDDQSYVSAFFQKLDALSGHNKKFMEESRIIFAQKVKYNQGQLCTAEVASCIYRSGYNASGFFRRSKVPECLDGQDCAIEVFANAPKDTRRSNIWMALGA